MRVYRSIIGDRKFEDLLSAEMADMMQCIDPSLMEAVQEYLKAQTDASTGDEAKSKLLKQWNALCIYRLAANRCGTAGHV